MKKRVLAVVCTLVVLAGAVTAVKTFRTCIEGSGGSGFNTITHTVNV